MRPRRDALPLFPRLILGATVVFLPLTTLAGGLDDFRIPKDSFLIAAGCALAICGAVAFATGPVGPGTTCANRLLLTIAAALGWASVCCVVATNPPISFPSIVWVASLMIFGLATAILAPGEPLRAAALPLLASVINAILFLFQRLHIWNPIYFATDVPDHFRYTALIGNPDDVASFFVAPVLAAVVLFLVSKGWYRAIAGVAIVILGAAVIAGQLTGILAVTMGVGVLLVMRRPRHALQAILLLTVTGIIIGAAYAPLRVRVQKIVSQARAGDYNEATSGRITPFLSAASMVRDHPIFGVGPHCFGWEYFRYKIAVEKRYPILARAYSHSFNFAETHNDHLQLMAECGVIGYVLVVASIVAIARATFRTRSPLDDVRSAFATTLIVPLSCALGVLCLAHFPLHLASSSVMFVYFGGLAWGWSGAGPAVVEMPRIHRMAASVASLLLVAASVGVAIRFAYLPFTCERIKRDIRQRTLVAERGADSFASVPRARENLERLRDCLNTRHGDVSLYMLTAANLRILSRPADAREMYETALRYDRRPELYYELGTVELDLGMRPAALATLYRAVLFSRKYLEGLPSDVASELQARLRREDPHLIDN